MYKYAYFYYILRNILIVVHGTNGIKSLPLQPKCKNINSNNR